jgi:hypothetical protein
MDILMRVEEFDILTVSIYPADSGHTTLRVVGQGTSASSDEPHPFTHLPSDKGEQHVQAILRRCGWESIVPTVADMSSPR